MISTGPNGKYKVLIQKREINDKDFSENNVLKFRGTGGPSNLFLSVIVPGLGDRFVSSDRKGLGVAITTYCFIGTGIFAKYFSNSAYDEYHKATVQTEIDKYYNYANYSNYAFYAFMGTAGAIWLYDIFYVANKGFKNQKKSKNYKNSISFNFYASPKALNMAYILKF